MRPKCDHHGTRGSSASKNRAVGGISKSQVPVFGRFMWLATYFAVHIIEHRYTSVFPYLVNLISFSHGSTIGWTSPVAAKLQADGETSLDKPLTWNEISWIGSFTFVGALCGAVCYYLLLRFFSLRKALLMLPFPTMVCIMLASEGDARDQIILAILFQGRLHYLTCGEECSAFDYCSSFGGIHGWWAVFVFATLCGRVIRSKVCTFYVNDFSD